MGNAPLLQEERLCSENFAKGFYVLSAAKQRLYWFKGVTSSGNIEAGEVSAGSIAVDAASVVQLVKLFIRGEKFGFEIEVEDDFDEEFKEAGKRGKRKWCLVAENEEERNAWVKSIERQALLPKELTATEDHRHFEEHSALVRYEQQQQQHQLQQQIQQQRAYQQQMQLHQQQLQHQQRMQSFGPSPPRLSLLGPSTSMGQVMSPTSIGSGFHYPVSATAHTTSTPSLTHRTSSQPGSFGSPTTPTAPMLPFSMQSQIQPTPPSTPTPSLALGSHTPSRFHLQDPLLRQLLLAQQALISVAMAKQQWSQPQLQMQQMGIGQGAPYGGGGSFSGLSPATLHASMKPPPPSSSSSGSTNSSGHFYRQSMGVPMGASVSAFSGLPSSMHSSLSSSTLPYYGNRVPGSGAAGVPSMILEGVESLDGGGTATPTPSFQ
ncbi:hypothetical protein DFJ73DRAFT_756547 [Zopfochytrium polystomum]|nr:hypothetical protein DFJ73DRAFT_756547 [Zopfochytrium polystomum]